jgi:hypothetical protein
MAHEDTQKTYPTYSVLQLHITSIHRHLYISVRGPRNTKTHVQPPRATILNILPLPVATPHEIIRLPSYTFVTDVTNEPVLLYMLRFQRRTWRVLSFLHLHIVFTIACKGQNSPAALSKATNLESHNFLTCHQQHSLS